MCTAVKQGVLFDWPTGRKRQLQLQLIPHWLFFSWISSLQMIISVLEALGCVPIKLK